MKDPNTITVAELIEALSAMPDQNAAVTFVQSEPGVYKLLVDGIAVLDLEGE